ncbi:MAG TPA: hypothetical protein VMW35_05670 [Myxococcota bacterium]|jgi:hypothetical protein|nr:hypothetical protein [Myxococcota bacterium]
MRPVGRAVLLLVMASRLLAGGVAHAEEAGPPPFVRVGAFCVPRAGSPATAIVGFGVAALGAAWTSRRRDRPGAGGGD